MRTTLTLDDDVAADIERLRRERDLSLKEVVNDVLRRGLHESRRTSRRRERFRTPPLAVGRCLLPSLDSVAHALAIAEGEDFR